MSRAFLAVVIAGLLLTATPAFADPPVTETTHEKGLVETFVDVVPTCEEDGALYTITTTSNLVMHERSSPTAASTRPSRRPASSSLCHSRIRASQASRAASPSGEASTRTARP